MQYDFLIVGAGLFGSVFAFEAHKKGLRCLVVDRRPHIGGNVYTQRLEGINVHKYGAHIFHTDDAEIWSYINQFAEFNRFTNCPLALYNGKLYNLPFNMNTFYMLWGVTTPRQAMEVLGRQRRLLPEREAQNLEEQAIRLVGTDIYQKLIREYTEKQWGRPASELPAYIIRRLPVRFTYDNNYFTDRYQGIPIGGYSQIIEKLLEGADTMLNTDFTTKQNELNGLSCNILYTGSIDEFYGYRLGRLSYRSLRFETKLLDEENFQGNAVVNYNSKDVAYTRIIEHKHFEFGTQDKTIITYEYPIPFGPGTEPYYPINDMENNNLYEAYRALAKKESRVFFGGRLGSYRYYDMDDVIKSALQLAKELL